MQEVWTKNPPFMKEWYWTRRIDGWYPNTLLPDEVKESGYEENREIHTLWGDHDIEWYSMPLPLPDGYDSHK